MPDAAPATQQTEGLHAQGRVHAQIINIHRLTPTVKRFRLHVVSMPTVCLAHLFACAVQVLSPLNGYACMCAGRGRLHGIPPRAMG